jgi:hypothetical protein
MSSRNERPLQKRDQPAQHPFIGRSVSVCASLLHSSVIAPRRRNRPPLRPVALHPAILPNAKPSGCSPQYSVCAAFELAVHQYIQPDRHLPPYASLNLGPRKRVILPALQRSLCRRTSCGCGNDPIDIVGNSGSFICARCTAARSPCPPHGEDPIRQQPLAPSEQPHSSYSPQPRSSRLPVLSKLGSRSFSPLASTASSPSFYPAKRWLQADPRNRCPQRTPRSEPCSSMMVATVRPSDLRLPTKRRFSFFSAQRLVRRTAAGQRLESRRLPV